MKKLIFTLMILLYACSSTKTSEQKSNMQYQIQGWKINLKNIEIDANFTTDFNGNEITMNSNVKISNTDSLQMNLNGPFGIIVGRLFADGGNFKFFNVLENKIYKGISTAENIHKASGIYVSIADLIRIIRGEVPFKPSEYIFSEVMKDSPKALFKRVDIRGFADFAVISTENNTIIQYQRKNKSDELILNLAIGEYSKIGEFELPQNFTASFPTAKAKLNINVNKFKINDEAGKVKNFDFPSSAVIVDLDKIN
jgi:hypothetical protein